MKLETIYELWAQDAVIDQTDLGNASLKSSELHQKYHKIYTNERLQLREVEIRLKQLKLEKFEFYTQGPTKETQERGWQLPPVGKVLRQDVQNYIEADNDIIQLTLKLGLQQEKVELLESIIRTINNRNYQVKNALDWLRFTSGGN